MADWQDLQQQGDAFLADSNLAGALLCWAEALYAAEEAAEDGIDELRVTFTRKLIQGHSRRGDWKAVLKVCDDAVAKSCRDSRVLHWRAVALGRLARFEDADAALVAFVASGGEASLAGRTRRSWDRARGLAEGNSAGPGQTRRSLVSATVAENTTTVGNRCPFSGGTGRCPFTGTLSTQEPTRTGAICPFSGSAASMGPSPKTEESRQLVSKCPFTGSTADAGQCPFTGTMVSDVTMQEPTQTVATMADGGHEAELEQDNSTSRHIAMSLRWLLRAKLSVA